MAATVFCGFGMVQFVFSCRFVDTEEACVGYRQMLYGFPFRDYNIPAAFSSLSLAFVKLSTCENTIVPV